MIRTSMACRVCHRGWWGERGDRCEKCGKPAVATGEVMVVDLRGAS